jgi:hypothetical protein
MIFSSLWSRFNLICSWQQRNLPPDIFLFKSNWSLHSDIGDGPLAKRSFWRRYSLACFTFLVQAKKRNQPWEENSRSLTGGLVYIWDRCFSLPSPSLPVTHFPFHQSVSSNHLSFIIWVTKVAPNAGTNKPQPDIFGALSDAYISFIRVFLDGKAAGVQNNHSTSINAESLN